jgi:acyl-CoA thioester hydrolase
MTCPEVVLPDRFEFSTQMQVRSGDLGYRGFLGEEGLARLLEEARVRYLQKIGYLEADVEGTGLACLYSELCHRTRPGYGEVVRIDVSAGEFCEDSFTFFLRVSLMDDHREVVRARQVYGAFGATSMRRVAIPEGFRRRCQGLRS